MRYKVVGMVGQSGKTIGYDVLSESGEKRTVTIQELVNAINAGVVVNARLNNGQIEFQGQLQRRVIEQVINIQLTESEFNILYPILMEIFTKLKKEHPEKNKKELSVLQKFVGYKNQLLEYEYINKQQSKR